MFLESLGGKVKIKACKPCNNSIGHDIEGPLQRPDQLLNLVKIGQGSGLPVRGIAQATGDEVEHNMITGELGARYPVTQKVVGDQATYNLRGSPEQVEAALRQMAKKYGWAEDTSSQLLASADQVDLGNRMLDTTVTTDLALAARLASKVALGAGCGAFGDVFLSCALAAEMRAVLKGTTTGVGLVPSELLSAFDAHIATFPPLERKVPLITPDRAERRSEAIFYLTATNTIVFVYLAGALIANGGLRFDQVFPGNNRLPVVLTDHPGKMSVRYLQTRLPAAYRELTRPTQFDSSG